MFTVTSKRAWVPIAVTLALTSGLAGTAAQNQAVEEFSALAINVNSRPTAPRRPTTVRLTIRIERWSTDAERDSLLQIVKQGDNVNRMNQALLTALQRMPRVGRIRETSSLGWDLRFARQAPLGDGGRQIVVATDRAMDFWEVSNRPRSFDYPFTVFEMHLDKNNQGEGKMLADTRVLIDPRTNELVMEQYDISPVRLNQIRPVR